METLLLTGIFGNTGQYVCKYFLTKGYKVIGFDIKNKINVKTAKKITKRFEKYDGQLNYHWGDLTDKTTFEILKQYNFDAVVHVAFIIPPFSELLPKMATKVNVEGTRNLVQFTKKQWPKAKFLFTSSVATYGYRNHKEPPITPDTPPAPLNNYSGNKIAAEKIVRESDLQWTILKFSAVMNPRSKISVESKRYAQSIYPYSKIEPVHVEDLSKAVFNAVVKPETLHKAFIVAGGQQNQTTYGEYIARQLTAFVPNVTYNDIPWEKFEPEPYYLHWYDTKNAQKILNYQSRSIDDYVEEFKKRTPAIKRFFAQFMKNKVIKETFDL